MPKREDRYSELLARTAKADPLAKQMLQSDETWSLRACIEREGLPEGPEDCLDVLGHQMAEFLKRFPAPPYIRQRYWDACARWRERLAGELRVEKWDPMGEFVPRPVTVDTGIALVKALHSERWKSKAELANEMGVSQKTVQTGLRALCPELAQGGEPAAPLRLGGQEMRAPVEERRMGKNKEYRMTERMHPVVLQWNTFQILWLLRALHRVDADAGCDETCCEEAAEIWSQLSEPGRARLRELAEADAELAEFFQDLDGLCLDVRPHTFRQERECRGDVTRGERLMLAFKAGTPVTLCLRRDGETECLTDVRLRWEGEERWRAIPRDGPDGENGVCFSTGELVSMAEND